MKLTEFEKMKAGEWYDANYDKELLDRCRCHDPSRCFHRKQHHHRSKKCRHKKYTGQRDRCRKPMQSVTPHYRRRQNQQNDLSIQNSPALIA